MDSISHDLNPEHRDNMRLSLQQFTTVAQSYLIDLNKAQQSLQWVYIPFKEQGEVRPIQCRVALESLDETSEYVQEMCGLLYRTSSLPIVMTALRYQLLLILNRIEEQIDNLVDLLNSYRLICITPSQHTLRQRKEIYDSFETLLQHLSDISQEANLIHGEAKFQERKLTAKLEEKSSADNASTGTSDSHGHLYIVKQHEDGFDAS
jgi:hypothetical protein